MNLVEPIFAQCRFKPAELALAAPGTHFNVVSYGRLAHSVENICHRIVSAKLGPGNRVGVFVEDPLLHALLVLALTRTGIVSVSGRARRISWPFSIDAVLTDKSFHFPEQRMLLVDESWTTGDNRPLAQQHIYRSRPEDICRIILTSGTTGEEKAVAVTNRMMVARIDRQNLFFGRQAAFSTRTWCDLGLATPLGFQLLLAMLWRGGTLFLTGDSQQTVSSLPIYRIQNMVASPGGLQSFVQAVEARPEYQCDLQAVFSGGSLLHPSLSERVRARICSNLTVGYGSTEATMVASMPAHFAAGVAGAVGRILPGINVEIVDENHSPLQPGAEGSIRIKSDYGVKEYFGDRDESARVFREGWFYPGDVGYITPDRILVITGRTKTTLNLAGEKINPERVEEVLSAHPTVERAAVLAISDERGADTLCALIVPRSTLNVEILEEYCKQKLPPQFVPSRFVVVREIPQNEMGKIERMKLPDILKAN